jgi:hypothetical protein
MPRPTGTVTFLLTDVERSSAQWDERATEMAVALAQHDALVRDAVVGAGGTVFSTAGDGFAAAFDTSASKGRRTTTRALNCVPNAAMPPGQAPVGRRAPPAAVEQQGPGREFLLSAFRPARVLLHRIGNGDDPCSSALIRESFVGRAHAGVVTKYGLSSPQQNALPMRPMRRTRSREQASTSRTRSRCCARRADTCTRRADHRRGREPTLFRCVMPRRDDAATPKDFAAIAPSA